MLPAAQIILDEGLAKPVLLGNEGRIRLLIFPDLQSANVAYKLVPRLGGAEAIGPILVGMRKPVHVLPLGSEVKDIVNMAAIAVVDAQEADRKAAERSDELEAVLSPP